MTGVQHKIVGTGFGIAGAYVVTKGMGDPYGVLIAPVAIVGSMLPDIDHDRTKIGRKRKFVTNLTTNMINALIIGGMIGACVLALITLMGFRDYGVSGIQLLIVAGGFVAVWFVKKFIMSRDIVKWATRHRGMMHTLVCPALFYFGMGISDFPLWRYTFMGLLIGYCSHLFADMQTVEGCPILFPLTRKNIKFMRLRTKNKSCTYAAWIDCFISIGVGYILAGGL